MEKKNAQPRNAELSATNNSANSTGRLSPREARALTALAHAQDWIAREAIDRIACALGYTSPKPKGPARRNAFGKAVATPTDKRGFAVPKFWGLVRLHRPRMVYGHGGGHPQGRPHGFTRVSNRHAHPLRVETQRVVLKSRKGATMTTTTQGGRTAPTPATHPNQLFADAVNAASMANWYTRRGNIAAAARKARQHLAALRLLAKLEGGAA